MNVSGTPAPGARQHPVIVNLVMMIVSCLVGLLGAEIMLRIVQPTISYAYAPQQIVVTHFRRSPFLPFELKPNNRSRFRMMEFDTTVVTNSLGLRGDEVDFRRPRVLCLGDSFTFGFGVENHEMFCDRLGRLFGGKYDFVNAGYADGFSPDAYALWLSKYGDRVKPDKIIVCLFQNDLADVSLNSWLRAGKPMDASDHGLPDAVARPGTVVTSDGAWLRDSVVARVPPAIRSLVKRSYVVALLRDRLLHDAEASAGESAVDAIGDRKFIRSLEMLLDVADRRLVAFYLIPEKQQKAPSHMDRLVKEFGDEHHVPVLANYGDFAEEDYFRYDGHWVLSGHTKASSFLHDALVQLGL